MEDRCLLAVGVVETSSVFHHEHEHGLGELEHLYFPPLRHVFDHGGFLTGPATAAPLAIATDYLTGQAATLGLAANDLNDFLVTAQYVSDHTGVTHIYLQQTLLDLPVLGANININISAQGEVINIGSSFVGGLGDQRDKLDRSPKLAAPDALAALARDVHWTLDATPAVLSFDDVPGQTTLLAASGISIEDIPAELVFVPRPGGGVELAWNMLVQTTDLQHAYNVSVSADDGELLHWSDWIAADSYRVFALPVENPHDGERTLVTDPAHPVASPFGWHDTNGIPGAEFTITRGNNVHAYTDRNDSNSPDPGSEPNGTAALVFDFPLDLNQLPLLYRHAAVTNLFYWNNILHDLHYQYGFTEVAGNFQVNNYGRGGLGGDDVRAEAQDGADLLPPKQNNANFFAPPDGQRPRMQMFEWSFTNPRRDGDFDNGIIIHEYGHGVSMRLTGGPANSNALNAIQSGGMGEGWSDWWALMFTQKDTDTKLDAYPIGTYVLGQSSSGTGIRRYPYSLNMAVNPLTYDHYNSSSQVHNAGEIWASALWDMNWLLIDAYGFDTDFYSGTGGNNLALQLVMDGLKLQPSNPSFLNGRDAILLADWTLTGGENLVAIWTAFARRGMGYSAYDGGSANSTAVVAAFDLPSTSQGIVQFNKDLYETGDVAAIAVRDLDLVGSGQIDVLVVSNGGDSETVTLFESSLAPGAFYGDILLVGSAFAPDNGVLEVAAGNLITVTYLDADDGAGNSAVRTDTARIIEVVEIYTANMDVDPGWTYEGQWAWGVPAGLGGDPSSGYTGANVVGYNLLGHYPNNMSSTQFATTLAIDCSNFENVRLSFWRWLRVETAVYDKAYIQVSNNGIGWETIWQHSGSTLLDSSWRFQQYDISHLADLQSTVYIRWGMGPTDSSVTYAGWNVDDVVVSGIAATSTVIYSEELNADPGWTTQGQWAFGQPAGLGGVSYGFPDPSSGATGLNVYGVNLNGDYSLAIGGPWFLTTTPISTLGFTNVRLSFQRWLNTDYHPYAIVRIEVSNDGTSWTNVFMNPTVTPIADNYWRNIMYPLGGVADDQETVYIRWGYQVGSSAFPYSGWNIDDVRLVGQSQRPTLPGDYTRDAAVDAADFVLWRKMLGAAVTPFDSADGDGNGIVEENDWEVWRANFGNPAAPELRAASQGAGPDEGAPTTALADRKAANDILIEEELRGVRLERRAAMPHWSNVLAAEEHVPTRPLAPVAHAIDALKPDVVNLIAPPSAVAEVLTLAGGPPAAAVSLGAPQASRSEVPWARHTQDAALLDWLSQQSNDRAAYGEVVADRARSDETDDSHDWYIDRALGALAEQSLAGGGERLTALLK